MALKLHRPKPTKSLPVPAVVVKVQPPVQPDTEADLARDLATYWGEQQQSTGLGQKERAERDRKALAAVADDLADCLDPTEVEQAVLIRLAGEDVCALPTDRQHHLDACDHCQRLVQAALLTPMDEEALAAALCAVANARLELVPLSQGDNIVPADSDFAVSKRTNERKPPI